MLRFLLRRTHNSALGGNVISTDSFRTTHGKGCADGAGPGVDPALGSCMPNYYMDTLPVPRRYKAREPTFTRLR